MDVLVGLLKDLIEFLYNICGDYGVSIVMVTVIVRLALLPFDLKQHCQVEK